MNFTVRQISVLEELLKHDSHISGNYLAELLGVSSRTIRTEIKEINTLIFNKDIRINSKNGKGYILNKKDKDLLVDLIDSKGIYQIPITPNARKEKIISELLLNPLGLTIKDLSSQLYISKSTAKRDLIEVAKVLKEYQLKLSGVDSRYFIDGEEEIIREMHRNYFFIKGIVPIYNENVNNELIEIYKIVKQITTRITNQFAVELDGETFQTIVAYIAITLFRIKHHAFIKTPRAIENISEWVIKLCEQLAIFKLEAQYLSLFIEKVIQKAKLTRRQENNSKEALQYITKIYDYPLSENLSLSLKEAIRTNAVIQSNDYNIKTLKREYPQCFEMAISYIDYLNLETTENKLLINIVLTFITDFESQMTKYEAKKRNVVLVTQSNEIAKMFLKTKLARFFKNFQVIKSLPIHKLKEIDKLDVDFIISTSAISYLNLPVIIIDPVLKDYDITKLRKFIRHIDHYENMNFEFENLFKESLYIKNIEAANPIEVIKRLHQQLINNGYTNNAFLDEVLKRERMSSTAIGNYVAIPHAIHIGSTENIITVGILNKPILWGKEKVQIVFLLNINSTSEGKVNQIFDTFFEIISSRKKVNNLIHSKDYHEFIRYIN